MAKGPPPSRRIDLSPHGCSHLLLAIGLAPVGSGGRWASGGYGRGELPPTITGTILRLMGGGRWMERMFELAMRLSHYSSC